MRGLTHTEPTPHHSGDVQNWALEKAQYHPEASKEERVILAFDVHESF